MRLTSILILTLLLASCTGIGNRYSLNSDFYYEQVTDHSVIDTYVMTPAVKQELHPVPASLRPTSSDYLTISTDINNDGKDDVLATINHYRFNDKGKHKLYVFVKNDYGYTQLKPYSLIDSYDLKVLESTTNGFRDLSVNGTILRYNGTTYR